TFPSQLQRGQPAQLLVDQRQELAGGVWIALLDGPEDLGHLAHGSPSANSQPRSASPLRYSGTTTSAPARTSRSRFQALTPWRFTSSLATATATPPALRTSSISTKPSPKP